jgi:hypothetical protein
VRWLGGTILLILGAATLAGCSSSAAASHGAGPGTTCGAARTAIGTPVVIKVDKGTVDCGTVLSVESEYAAMVRDGQVKGNGGGAPVTVNGWICQGYPTPQVLATGDTSQCHDGAAEVLAVLPAPTPTPAPATSPS